MTLADTPTNWPPTPPMPSLQVLLIFVGIPLLVITTVSLLVLIPSWVKGPRYRPGQPWDAESEWFGAQIAAAPAAGPDDAAQLGAAPTHDETTGGASAGW